MIGSGAAPSVSLYQKERLKSGAWGKVKPLRVDHDTLDQIDDASDRRVLGLLFGNRVERVALDHYGYPLRQSGFESTRVELAPELYSAVLPELAATGQFVWLLSNDQDWEDAVPLGWDDGPAWGFRVRAQSDKKKWRLAGELTRDSTPDAKPVARPVTDAIKCFESGLVLIDNRLARFDSPRDPRWIETLCANEELVIPRADRQSLLNELWRSGEAPEIVSVISRSACPARSARRSAGWSSTRRGSNVATGRTAPSTPRSRSATKFKRSRRAA